MNSRIMGVSVFLLFLLSCMLFSVSYAQNFTVTEFPISTAPQSEVTFSSACDGTNYLVAWVYFNYNGNSIHARLVDPSGKLLGDELSFGTSSIGTIDGEAIFYVPVVAYDGSNYLVAWHDKNDVVNGQFITPNGTELGSTFQITRMSYHNRLATMTFGGSYFLYLNQDSNNVYGSFISKSSAGTPGIPVKNVLISSTQNPDNSVAAFDGTRFLVLWRYKYYAQNSGDIRELHGKFVDISGPIGSEFKVAGPWTESDMCLHSVGFGDRNYLAVWSLSSGKVCPAYGDGIRGAFITAEGSVGPEFSISGAGNQLPWGPVLFNDGNFTVIWTNDITGESSMQWRKVSSAQSRGEIYTLLARKENGLPSFNGGLLFDGERYFMALTRATSTLLPEEGGIIITGGDIYGESIRMTLPDATPPTTTASASDDKNAAYMFSTPKNAAYINVVLSCDDGNGTGCSLTKYCIDVNNQCAPSQTYSMPMQISNQGVSYIRYHSTDNSGNKEVASSQSVWIDNTPPEVSVKDPLSGSQLSNRTVAVTVTVSDTGLNKTVIEAMKDNRVVASITSEKSGTFIVSLEVPEDGTYKIVATVYDNALNSRSFDVTNIEVKTACKGIGMTCVFGTECCSGACSDGKCIAAIVRPTEQPPAQDNTMLFIAIIAAVLIVVAVLAFFLRARGKSKPPAQPTAQEPTQSAVPK